MNRKLLNLAIGICLSCGGVASQVLSADDVVTISDEQRAELEQGMESLERDLLPLAVSTRRDPGPSKARLYDTMICAKAVDWILRHNEFYQESYVADAMRVLEIGHERATAARPTWGLTPGSHVLAYMSRIDNSLQPYAVTLPEGFDPEADRDWPVYVVLHGRNGRLNEVSFFRQFEGKPPQEGADWIQLDVFGRVNNAYRWGGEVDVFEALEDLKSRYRVDDRRITLWGFSMGGAGAWHLGLHHPSTWCSVGAGAGFVDFYGYQKREEPLIPAQHHGLHIYDAVDYATNLSVVPFITYGGEDDPQLLASTTMQALADAEVVPLEMLVGPGMGHRFDDESLARFMAFHAEHNARGRPEPPGLTEFDFTTWTLRYNQCEWLEILETGDVTQPMTARAQSTAAGRVQLDLENVNAIRIHHMIVDRVDVTGRPLIQGRETASFDAPVTFARDGQSWRLLSVDEDAMFETNSDLHKRPGLQGPIDDAFMDSFVCVRGTGTPWNTEHEAWAEWNLDRFESEYDKWMRCRLRALDDIDVNDDQIGNSNLILFGDPGSNSVIRRIVEDLPVEWTPEGFRIEGAVDDQWHDPSEHAFAMIFPNPLNPAKYVVINSGMTMHERDFRASNAWLFPKLGDVAVIEFSTNSDSGFDEEILCADVFDANWELPTLLGP